MLIHQGKIGSFKALVPMASIPMASGVRSPGDQRGHPLGAAPQELPVSFLLVSLAAGTVLLEFNRLSLLAGDQFPSFWR
jgi:hypothetical protein